MDRKTSLTVCPTLTVKPPVDGTTVPAGRNVVVKFHAHCRAVTTVTASGFCGIVSVTTRGWNPATPTTTRMIAGMTVHNVSSLRSWVFALTGPTVWPLRTRNLITAYATRTRTRIPIATAGTRTR